MDINKLVGELKVSQDVPPRGGFPPIMYNAPIQGKGISGAALFGAMTLLSMWAVWQNNERLNFRKHENATKRRAFVQIVPLLLAEKDRIDMRLWQFQLDEEALIMKDVPGWTVGEGVYRTRWVPPPHTRYVMDLFHQGKIEK